MGISFRRQAQQPQNVIKHKQQPQQIKSEQLKTIKRLQQNEIKDQMEHNQLQSYELTNIKKMSVFAQDFAEKVQPKLPNDIIQALQHQCWNLIDNDDDWCQVLRHLQETSIKKLMVHLSDSNSYLPLILYKLPQIKFNHLKQLLLPCLHITSIESLAFINAPHLEVLALNENSLTTIKPIIKQNWPKLNSLNVRMNKINELVIDRIRMDLASEKKFRIQINCMIINFSQDKELRGNLFGYFLFLH